MKLISKHIIVLIIAYNLFNLNAQRISIGTNLIMPLKFNFHAVELNTNIFNKKNAMGIQLTAGRVCNYKLSPFIRDNFSGKYLSTVILFNLGKRDVNKYTIGPVFTTSIQDETYYYIFGNSKYNIIKIDQKNTQYYGMGLLMAYKIFPNKRISIDFQLSLQTAQLKKGSDKIINTFIFGMGSQNNSDPFQFNKRRCRFQVNLNFLLIDFKNKKVS